MVMEGRIYFWLSVGAISIAILFISIAGIHHHILDQLLLAISVVILSRMVYVLVRKRRISVDLLMGVAGLVTWYLHAYKEGFLIFALYALSELIEEYSEIRAKRKLSDIREIIPSSVEVKTSRGIVEKKLGEVEVGDLILVKPGNIVPVDGVVVEGYSSFDTSYVTGESLPVVIREGEVVYSGYVNKDQMVIVEALKKPGESLLQLLVREAEKALRRKASIEKFLERFSQPYTLIVLLFFALASLNLGPYRGLSILLAGCPSAFILSTSTATALSITLLSRRSIVVRGGVVLERASRLKSLILDKTGTITFGEMDIVDVKTIDTDGKVLLEYAGGAAKASDHPVSRILSRYSRLFPSRAVEYPGRGVEAWVDGVRVLIGSSTLMAEKNIVGEIIDCGEGFTEVHVAINDRYAGVICLEDKLTEDVKNVVNDLKNMGLHLVIASGDRRERVKRIASLLGIDEYYGELLPDDKRRLAARIREKYGSIGFVGDGINDVEAIAEADVGIAIGSLRVVSNIGDAVLIKGIGGLSRLIGFARRYMNTIYLSIIAVSIVKLGAMITGLAGLIPLWLVVAIGDDGSTILSIALISYLLSRRI